MRTGCSSCTLQMLTQPAHMWVQAQGNLWTLEETCLLPLQPWSYL